MSKEAMKLALEYAKPSVISPGWTLVRNEDITALREALAQDVPEVGFGNMALDKMAENARELGLDYEPVWDNLPSNKDVEDAMRLKRLSQLAEQPAQQEPIKQGWDVDTILDKPIPLKDFYEPAQQEPVAWMYDWICDGKLLEGWIAHKESEIPRSLASNIRPLYTSPPAQQEPVAWMDGYRNIYSLEEKAAGCPEATIALVPMANHKKTSGSPIKELNCICGAVWEGDELVHLPRPPAQRTWVGLTFAEICECENDYLHIFARAIEAKLREKNT